MFYTTSAALNGKMRPFRYIGDMPVPEMSYKPGTSATINEDAISSGLVLSYLFNEGTGTTLTDKASSPVSGTLTNGAWDSDETYTSIVDFNEASMTASHSVKFNIETYTLAFAFRIADNPGDYVYMVNKFGGSGAYPYLTYLSATGAVGAAAYDGSTTRSADTTGGFADNNWHKCVVTRQDGAAIKIYIDGTLRAEAVDDLSGSSTNSFPLKIEAFGGQIAYLHIWNRVLSGAPGSVDDPATGEIAALAVDEFLMYR